MNKFWHSFQFKIPAVFIVSFFFILAAIFTVFTTIGKDLLAQQAYKQVTLSGQNIVSELGNRIALVESLATALANLGEKLPVEDDLTKTVTEHVMNYEGTESFIAGGGIWPEPFKYDPAVERHSFFWGRNSNGELEYYDDYNNPDGPGYHHEEWYVPAKYLKPGQAFWSKSYMDPYSYQPMVTVTVPMFRDNEFYGVSTVDLKLEGLHDLLEKVSESFGGYAFAVDRNGTFLSYPDESITKLYRVDEQGGRVEEFIGVQDLEQKRPRFQPLAKAIMDSINNGVINANVTDIFNNDIVKSIADDSYQVDHDEAVLIAAVLADLSKPQATMLQTHTQLFLEQDILLGEPALVAVFEMPKTYWKIITVMPNSKAIETSDVIYRNLIGAILVVMLLSLIVTLYVVRSLLVKPVMRMSQQLKLFSEDDESENKLLNITDRSELGNLAYWFNKRSQKLYKVQDELRSIHEDLEIRITERTEELRREIDKRKSVQAVKDEYVARVEKQHASIVGLSVEESLFEGDINRAAQIINETAAKVIDTGRCSIWLIDDQEQYLKAVDLYDRSNNSHSSDMSMLLKDHPDYIQALREHRSIAVSNVFEDSRTAELVVYSRDNKIVSLLDSPIRVGGKLRGVVCFEHLGYQRDWHDDEIRFSGEVADQFILALANSERIQSEEQIRLLAFYDPLTSLANRRLLQETIRHELEVAKRHEVFGALLYLDLDNFKTLNDSLGHAIGDELLVQVSERIRNTIRKEDTAARLGGDEFVVLITGEYASRPQAMDQALNVATKLQSSLSESYRLQGYEHIITSSMGITLYPEEDGISADILKQADAAMYRAKSSGRNEIRFYNPEMQREASHRLLMEKELRNAITDQKFEMYFQPQVDSRGETVGIEALIRWKHSERGIIPPAEFIPVAEDTGLILELGPWILRDSCEFGKQCSVKHVAVNISPLQFRQPDFVDSVASILQETGASPEHLMIELTEGIVIENIEDTISKMNALKEMGIQFAIDDFGTGYSSLAYLKLLPLDQLKINNDFVRDINTDPNDAIIVETIISMAQHLGLDVVAEGVETEGQLDFLNEKGCRLFQGNYFSVPLTKESFREYKQDRKQDRGTDDLMT